MMHRYMVHGLSHAKKTACMHAKQGRLAPSVCAVPPPTRLYFAHVWHTAHGRAHGRGATAHAAVQCCTHTHTRGAGGGGGAAGGRRTPCRLHAPLRVSARCVARRLHQRAPSLARRAPLRRPQDGNAAAFGYAGAPAASQSLYASSACSGWAGGRPAGRVVDRQAPSVVTVCALHTARGCQRRLNLELTRTRQDHATCPFPRAVHKPLRGSSSTGDEPYATHITSPDPRAVPMSHHCLLQVRQATLMPHASCSTLTGTAQSAPTFRCSTDCSSRMTHAAPRIRAVPRPPPPHTRTPSGHSRCSTGSLRELHDSCRDTLPGIQSRPPPHIHTYTHLDNLQVQQLVL